MAVQGDIQYRLKIFLRWQEALERIASKEGARLESWPGSLQPGSERRYSLNTPRPLASSLDEYSGNFGCSAAMARPLSLTGQRLAGSAIQTAAVLEEPGGSLPLSG